MSFFAELKRRNVFRVAIFYIVSAWLLLQIADLIFEVLLVPAWTLRFMFGALVAAFPFALFLAWAYELTPEGIKRESAVDRSTSITTQTGSRLNVITLLVVLGAVATFLADRFLFDAAPEAALAAQPAQAAESAAENATADSPPSNGVAVLPFADLSPEGDQRYFSHGIAEELLNVLVRIPELQVASRTSSFQFADRDLAIPEIAAALKVRYVLEGSVRKAGDTLRITAQLIDADNDRHLWSDTFDRPLTAENVFAIQDEIAQAIVTALSGVLSVSTEAVDVSATTGNLDAYQLYLKARSLFLSRIRLDEVSDLLGRAVELDPGFSAAWALRAATQPLLSEYGFATRPVAELLELAEAYADRALALDPESATALAALGQVRSNRAWELRVAQDYDAMLADFERALAIEPNNGSALNWRGLALGQLGRLEDALADFRTCERYEPYYAPCIVNLHLTLAALGREEEAYASFHAALDRGVPHVPEAYLPLFARLGEAVNFKLVTNSKAVLGNWRRHNELWRAFQNPLGDHSELLRELEAFLDERDASYLPRMIITGALGGTSVQPNPVLVWDPAFAAYRRTEAFQEQIRRSGVLAHWQTHGFPSGCRPQGEDGFTCD